MFVIILKETIWKRQKTYFFTNLEVENKTVWETVFGVFRWIYVLGERDFSGLACAKCANNMDLAAQHYIYHLTEKLTLKFPKKNIF